MGDPPPSVLTSCEYDVTGVAPNTVHRTRTSVQTTRTHVQIFRTNVQMLTDGLIWTYPVAALDVTIRNQNQN